MIRSRLSSALFALALMAPVMAQESAPQAPPAPEVSSTVVVPVVGSTMGATEVQWRTSVELVNELPEEVTIALEMPTMPQRPAIVTSLAPGARMTFADVVTEAFGIDAALSPLVITTLARRSVTVIATAYGVRGTEQFRPQPIAIDYGATYFPTRTLHNLSFNERFRTNIGLVNLAEREVEFILGLQRIAGRNIGVTRITLPPLSLSHVPIQSMFPLISNGDNFTVIAETSEPNTFVYASVIENTSTTATFIRSTITATEP
jgi:hypothetical protein